MEKIVLKHPPGHYSKRFNRFLWLLISVRGMAPRNRHLWKVMDGVPFQDTETALEVALLNQGKTLDAANAEQLSFAINSDGRAAAPHTPRRATSR